MLIINDIIAFIIEIASLVLYGKFFYGQSDKLVIKIILALLYIVVFGIIWGKFFAPNAKNPLQGGIRWTLEFVILILPWILNYYKKPKYILFAAIIIATNLIIQGYFGRSNL